MPFGSQSKCPSLEVDREHLAIPHKPIALASRGRPRGQGVAGAVFEKCDRDRRGLPETTEITLLPQGGSGRTNNGGQFEERVPLLVLSQASVCLRLRPDWELQLSLRIGLAMAALSATHR